MRNLQRIQQNLRESRQELRSRGLCRDAIRVALRHPMALDVIEAAEAGEALEPDRVPCGPRRGLRHGYACEREEGEWAVVEYRPEGETCGQPYGEERRVVWRREVGSGG